MTEHMRRGFGCTPWLVLFSESHNRQLRSKYPDTEYAFSAIIANFCPSERDAAFKNQISGLS